MKSGEVTKTMLFFREMEKEGFVLFFADASAGILRYPAAHRACFHRVTYNDKSYSIKMEYTVHTIPG